MEDSRSRGLGEKVRSGKGAMGRLRRVLSVEGEEGGEVRLDRTIRERRSTQAKRER